MPRRSRIASGGLVDHVLNRAVARLALFEKQAGYTGGAYGDAALFLAGECFALPRVAASDGYVARNAIVYASILC